MYFTDILIFIAKSVYYKLLLQADQGYDPSPCVPPPLVHTSGQGPAGCGVLLQEQEVPVPLLPGDSPGSHAQWA